MRETRNSINLSQQPLLNDKKTDVLQQAVEREYIKLFRKIHKTTQKSIRHILRNVNQRPPLQPLTFPLLNSSTEFNTDDDDNIQTISVTISDGNNQKPQKNTTIATIMPTVSAIRELISYVPTTRNIATRGALIGIPYLGDTFNAEDQKLINSISGESTNQNNNLTRKKKLDEQSLEILYQTIRSNIVWDTYSNEQIIDAILHYHRDITPRTRLITIANQEEITGHKNIQYPSNIDIYDTVDIDIDDLIIKPWCSRFCSRCYTYNCLLHKEKSSHLPLPEQISICNDNQSSPCSSSCYKHEREHLKRSLSPPSHINEESSHSQTYRSISSDLNENVNKRRRKSTPFRRISSSNKLIYSHNENFRTDLYLDSHLQLLENQKKLTSQQLLTRIENHMTNTSEQQQQQISLANNWTLTDRTLFRLFYFLFDGDLCAIKHIFNDHRTCQDFYQQFILDTKYFSNRIVATNNLSFIIRQPYRRKMLDGATRAFLFHIKKHLNNSNNTFKSAYQPCLHDGPCTLSNENCYCMKNGTYCEKYCNCSIDCPHRFPGCTCKGACLLNNCLCCAEGRECDPDLCHKCGASLFLNEINDLNPIIKSEPETSFIERKTLPNLSRRNIRLKMNGNLPTRQHSLRSCRNVEPSYKLNRSQTKRTSSRTSINSTISSNLPMITCANISLQRKLYKQILIAESDVAGYGAFLGSSVAYPGDLIAEYTGEIITEEEADRRGRLYDKQACSYLFNLDEERCVDARQFGNKIRFANHSSKPNCVPKIKLVNGDYRIGIYAKQAIFQGDELFFEYMYDAHQRQQFVNNERVDDSEQDGLIILKRFPDNYILVRPSSD
ncbi:unnamed protein product [Adineta steineri]|uniref:[histone H3]-lysine(27) N-trimethyltransferase n=1 Tax=Adineta steineri TaxID=433720 RepID=A0A818UCC0_9BILA|nr:unnamed protein product [Adineta steineri]